MWKFSILVGILFLAVIAGMAIINPEMDPIVNHAKGREKDLLARVQRYCYSINADQQTCRLYLREYTDYAFNHDPDPAEEVAQLPAGLRESFQRNIIQLPKLPRLANVLDNGQPSSTP